MDIDFYLAGTININTATAEKLQTISGIGTITLQKIKDQRLAYAGAPN